jgi:hypothetical protein
VTTLPLAAASARARPAHSAIGPSIAMRRAAKCDFVASIHPPIWLRRAPAGIRAAPYASSCSVSTLSQRSPSIERNLRTPGLGAGRISSETTFVSSKNAVTDRRRPRQRQTSGHSLFEEVRRRAHAARLRSETGRDVLLESPGRTGRPTARRMGFPFQLSAADRLARDVESRRAWLWLRRSSKRPRRREDHANRNPRANAARMPDRALARVVPTFPP